MKRSAAGLSYVEVLVAVLLMSVALVPMMNAFTPSIQGVDLHSEKLESHYALAGVLETVLAESFFDLDEAADEAGAYTTATRYSDSSASIPYEVFIWRYDADNLDRDDNPFTGGEDDLLWIKVSSADGQYSLQTLRSRY